MNKVLMFSCKNIEMKFPGTVALQGVDLDIYEGEIIGLVGENGAGKSTLLKIIAGGQKQTNGEMQMYGETYAPQNSKEANQNRVGMVYQEQSLIPNLTIGQNVFLGREKQYSRFKLINYKKMYDDTSKMLVGMGIKKVKPNSRVYNYDFAIRQMVDIAKVINTTASNPEKSLSTKKALFIFDEPTTVLNSDEINKLFEELRKLKELGHSIVFVSHRLQEVIGISDKVCVFKDGHKVGMYSREEITEDFLYEKMVGRTSSGEYYKENKQIKSGENVIFEAKNIGLFGRLKDISFKLHEHEVLGICGVVGSGKEELCDIIIGIEPFSSGEMRVNNMPYNPMSPNQAIKAGVICVPKERNEDGILKNLNVYENITLSSLNKTTRHGLISRASQIKISKNWIKELNIKPDNCLAELSSLSGGNAQKVVFARVLNSDANIIILNHPTRGIDVGAKEDIYQFIRDAVNRPKTAIILLGDTLDECIGLSSEILVMKDGVITKYFVCDVGKKPEQLEIVKYMM